MAFHEAVEHGFELDVAGPIEDWVARYGLRFRTNLANLQTMAEKADVSLPDNPRVVLLAPGQLPHLGDNAWQESDRPNQYLPCAREDDVTVYWRNEIIDSHISLAVAQALRQQRRDDLEPNRKRLGWSVAASGVAASGIGEVIVHNQVLALGGYAVAFAGGLYAAYIYNRGPASIPSDMLGLPTPLSLLPHPM